MIILRRISIFGAILAVSFGTSALANMAQAGVTHASHRAFYEISIGRVDPSSTIIDARGRMVAEWREACEGWTTTQRLLVSMAPGEGEIEVYANGENTYIELEQQGFLTTLMPASSAMLSALSHCTPTSLKKSDGFKGSEEDSSKAIELKDFGNP